MSQGNPSEIRKEFEWVDREVLWLHGKVMDHRNLVSPEQPRRLSSETLPLTTPFREVQVHKRCLLLHKAVEDTLGKAMHRLRCPSHEWVRGQVFIP